MDDWTEKYRPQTLTKLVGNRKTVQQLIHWAKQWDKQTPSKRAVILSGKPGIGKTSCAYALAHDFKWIPIELNTSDARNEQRIKAVATAGAMHQTFNDQGDFVTTEQGGRKLIILDEADNLYERIKGNTSSSSDLSDRGGKRTIIQTIKETQQPIVLIVNDYYQLIKGSGSLLKTLALHLKWFPPFPHEIQRMLHQICLKENITTDNMVLKQISKQSNGDLRSAVRDLQSLCVNKKQLTKEDIMVLGNRDRKAVIFDVLKTIFTRQNIENIRQQTRAVDEDPRSLLFWVAENIPNSYQHPIDRFQAFDAVSHADMYLGRTFRRQYYGLWSYASDAMSLGVAYSKSRKIFPSKYQFPTLLKSKKNKKQLSAAKQSVLQKLSSYHHCSLSKTESNIYPFTQKLFTNNNQFALHLIKKLDLSEEESITFLEMKKNEAKKYIKNIKNDVNTNKKKQEKTKEATDKNKPSEEKSNQQKEQSLLFDF